MPDREARTEFTHQLYGPLMGWDDKLLLEHIDKPGIRGLEATVHTAATAAWRRL
jgi:hypothetical protein